MPELPEVETTRRGVSEAIVGRAITAFDLREPRLRWPVEPVLATELVGQRIHDVLAGELATELPIDRPAQTMLAQHESRDRAAAQRRADAAAGGFDFGELGHGGKRIVISG